MLSIPCNSRGRHIGRQTDKYMHKKDSIVEESILLIGQEVEVMICKPSLITTCIRQL